MNYVKHALTLLLIAGFSSANAQPFIAVTVNGTNIITPIIEIIKASKTPLKFTALIISNALCADFCYEKAKKETLKIAQLGWVMTGTGFSLIALEYFIHLQQAILNS